MRCANDPGVKGRFLLWRQDALIRGSDGGARLRGPTRKWKVLGNRNLTRWSDASWDLPRVNLLIELETLQGRSERVNRII